MNRKIKFLKRTALFLCIMVFSANCTNDDNLQKHDSNLNAKLKETQKWFSKYESEGENYFLLDNLRCKWDEAKITNSEDGTETTIVPIIESKKDDREFWEQRLYIYKTGEKEYKALVYEIATNKHVPLSKHSIDGGDFTGFISVWDLKNGFVRAARFENNKVIETGVVEIIDYTTRNATNKAPVEAPCVYADFGDGGCGGKSGGDSSGIPLREVVVTAPSKGSPVEYYGPRSPVIGGSTTGGYTSPTGGGANTGGGGITAPTPAKIIDELTGKAKCLNALLNKNGNSIVQNLLANFAGTSEFDIKIISKDIIIIKDENGNSYEVNGTTTYSKLVSPSLINIEISTSRQDLQSALDAARTILHEYIHADIFRKLNTKATATEILDFKKEYEKYGNQHSAMAKLYLDSMKEALKDFHKNILTEDYNKYINYYGEVPNDAFYEAMAWRGLKENNIKEWTDLTEAKKEEITKLAGRATMLSKMTPCN